MDSEILKHMPRSFQIWLQIEREAEKRAEAKFQEILRKGKAAGCPPQQEKTTHDTLPRAKT